jgi:FKBP-type peptidyl-prolyl cis-trans isomerase SlyD
MAIQNDNVVSIEYEVRDGDKVIDSNVGQDDLVFIYGKGQIIPGLEAGIKDMQIGQKADILVKAADAYGEYNEEATQEVPKEQFAGIELEEGMTLYGQGADGSTVQVTVKEIGKDSVIVDFNHPLAGKDLMFSVTLKNVREATEDELASGIPAENAQDDEHCGGGCGCH